MFYFFSQKPVLSEILPQFRECTEKELSLYPGPQMKYILLLLG